MDGRATPGLGMLARGLRDAADRASSVIKQPSSAQTTPMSPPNVNSRAVPTGQETSISCVTTGASGREAPRLDVEIGLRRMGLRPLRVLVVGVVLGVLRFLQVDALGFDREDPTESVIHPGPPRVAHPWSKQSSSIGRLRMA